MVYRVNKTELEKGMNVEIQEHSISPRLAKRLARQHLQEHPTYYRVMPMAERMMAQQERGIGQRVNPRDAARMQASRQMRAQTARAQMAQSQAAKPTAADGRRRSRRQVLQSSGVYPNQWLL